MASSDVTARRVSRDSDIALRAMTWNVAAINNNPFEYWIEHPDPAYNEMMAAVGAMIADPASFPEVDRPLGELFTDEMWQELKVCIISIGVPAADIARVESIWWKDLKGRKIVSEFLMDGSLGKKRLASMPDRLTNTINASNGTTHARPSIINCYAGAMPSVSVWWPQWLTFLFVDELPLKTSISFCDQLCVVSEKDQVLAAHFQWVMKPCPTRRRRVFPGRER